MTAKPLVICDTDGVLANFSELMVDAIYQVTGRNYHWREVNHWNFWLKIGLTPEQCAGVFEVLNTPGECESMQVLPGAVEGVELLREVAEIVIVTTPWATAPTWAYERTQWLRTHFGFTPGHIIHTAAKEFVSADFFVDDHPGNARSWNARNAGIGLLWSHPHNAAITDVPRINSWEELVQLIEDSKKGIAA